MTHKFLQTYFGPLPQKYCNYFYFLSLLFGIYFMVLFFTLGGYVLMNFGKIQLPILIQYFFMLISAFIVYFANRLMYTMCINSIH